MGFPETAARVCLLEVRKDSVFILRPGQIDGRQVNMTLDVLTDDVDAVVYVHLLELVDAIGPVAGVVWVDGLANLVLKPLLVLTSA